MLWIRVRNVMRGSPKWRILAGILGVSEQHVQGAVIIGLWLVTAEHAVPAGQSDALLKHWDAAMLDAECGTPGLSAALCDPRVRWAKITKAGVVLPEFRKHNQLACERAEIASRAAAKRWGDAHRMQRASVEHAPSTCTSDARTMLEKRREEKIREEEKTMTPAAQESAPTAAKPASGPAAAGVGGNADGLWGLAKFGVRLAPKTRAWSGITEYDRAAWARAYPAVVLDVELAKAAEWCVSEPTRGRKSNYRKFLAAWLSRAQDSGGTRNAAPVAADAGATPKRDYAAIVKQAAEGMDEYAKIARRTA